MYGPHPGGVPDLVRSVSPGVFDLVVTHIMQSGGVQTRGGATHLCVARLGSEVAPAVRMD